jgi:hypothetical protein
MIWYIFLSSFKHFLDFINGLFLKKINKYLKNREPIFLYIMYTFTYYNSLIQD